MSFHNDISEALVKIIALDHKLALKIIDSIHTGISIVMDVSCKEIRHNRIAAGFLRINPWDSFSLSALEISPARVFHQGNELTPGEMPIRLAAWYGQNVKDMEIEFVWDDGVRKISVWSASPLFDDNGIIVGAVATFEDITEQRRLEFDLAEANRKLLEQKELIFS